jgi:hypothetical protein
VIPVARKEWLLMLGEVTEPSLGRHHEHIE